MSSVIQPDLGPPDYYLLRRTLPVYLQKDLKEPVRRAFDSIGLPAPALSILTGYALDKADTKKMLKVVEKLIPPSVLEQMKDENPDSYHCIGNKRCPQTIPNTQLIDDTSDEHKLLTLFEVFFTFIMQNDPFIDKQKYPNFTPEMYRSFGLIDGIDVVDASLPRGIQCFHYVFGPDSWVANLIGNSDRVLSTITSKGGYVIDHLEPPVAGAIIAYHTNPLVPEITHFGKVESVQNSKATYLSKFIDGPLYRHSLGMKLCQWGRFYLHLTKPAAIK